MELNEVVEGLPIYTDANKLHGVGETYHGPPSSEPLVKPNRPAEKKLAGTVAQYQQTGPETDWQPTARRGDPDYLEGFAG